MLEEPVDAGDADVIEMLDAIAHDLRGEQGFFGDRNVAGAGGDDENLAFAGDFAIALDGDDAGEGMKFCNALRGSGGAPDGGEGGGVGASDEYILAAVFGTEHGPGDVSNLLGRFALGEDDFGVALAQCAVMVDLGEAEILEGEMLEAVDGAIGREGAKADEVEEFVEFAFFHG